MRKLRVDLRGSSLFVALLLKYRLLNRQIVNICRLRGDDCPLTSTGALCSHSL